LALERLEPISEAGVRLAVARVRLRQAEHEANEAATPTQGAVAWAKVGPARDELRRLTAEQEQRLAAERRAVLPPDGNKDLWLLIGGSILMAFLMTTPLELRHLRVIQMVLLPCLLMAMRYLMMPAPASTHANEPASVAFLRYLPLAMTVAALLGANIAYFCARVVEGTIDPHDWTPQEEELAMAPVRRLVQEDRYREALEALEKLLSRHKPTYEALLLKAKLLNHFGQSLPARQTLLSMLRLTRSAAQQTAVMQGLRELRVTATP
jgi:hypothetical protein